ncbi:hypothetical protein [Actibacterium sp. D379-3]
MIYSDLPATVLVNDSLPATPEEAIARGLNRYFTGLPCRNGHTAPRRVKDRYCTACKCAAEKRRLARRAKEQTE